MKTRKVAVRVKREDDFPDVPLPGDRVTHSIQYGWGVVANEFLIRYNVLA